MDPMTKIKKRIDIAAGRLPADLVLKNCRVVDVYSAVITERQDIALSDGFIAGVGSYHGKREIDCDGLFAAPGLIDAHIHIESAYVTPEEMGRLLVPHGTTTIIADPHEIVNVSGEKGLQFMLDAAELTKLDIQFMVPSCVPATPFEHSGAVIDAEKLDTLLEKEGVLGLGEFMDYPGVVSGSEPALSKILTAQRHGKLIDGHSPGLSGKALTAYSASGIHTDHECATVQEMQDRIARGMYVLLREGSACHDLRALLPGVTPANSRRCLLCSDDRQPETILTLGHLENHLRICVEKGISPVTALQMASLNASECFHLFDRGAIAPGRRADIVLFEDLKDFRARRTFILGEEVARDGAYLPKTHRIDPTPLLTTFHVKDFSVEKLRLPLKSGHVHVIDVQPGGVLTGKGVADIELDASGAFSYDPTVDIVKVAVVERHQNTGNVAVALLRGYGIRSGAIALSVAHDSHNIIVSGTNDADMALAVKQLIAQKGGIILAKDGKIVNRLPFVVGGLMSDQSGEWVAKKLKGIHQDAYEKLGVSHKVEPVMTLCFMSLPVIPKLKLTDEGLFDVEKFHFIPVDAKSDEKNTF